MSLRQHLRIWAALYLTLGTAALLLLPVSPMAAAGTLFVLGIIGCFYLSVLVCPHCHRQLGGRTVFWGFLQCRCRWCGQDLSAT